MKEILLTEKEMIFVLLLYFHDDTKLVPPCGHRPCDAKWVTPCGHCPYDTKWVTLVLIAHMVQNK